MKKTTIIFLLLPMTAFAQGGAGSDTFQILVTVIVILIFSVLFTRWVFSISRFIKIGEAIVKLLAIIAEKNGGDLDRISNIIKRIDE